MRRKILAILSLCLLMVLLCVPAMALALSTDSAGNVFADATVSQTIQSDLYAMGETIGASSSAIGGSAILAGRSVRVDHSTVAGSIRAAGYDVSLSGAQAGANATLAGYTVHIGEGCTARGVYAAAYSIVFNGECETFGAAAQNVTLNGTVNGDAYIQAEQVTLGNDLIVNGTLHVTATAAPTLPASAKVGNLAFTQAQTETTSDAVTTAAATVAVVNPIFAKLKTLLLYLPGRMVLAVLFYFAIGGSLRRASGMITARPVAMPLSGLIALLSLPIAAIVLMVTYIGIPAGVLLLCLYTLSLCFAVSFAGCFAGVRLFPKLHPLVASLIGVAGVTLLKLIPYVGGLLTFACIVYTLGYFVQDVYLRNKRPAPDGAAPGGAAPDGAAPDGVAPIVPAESTPGTENAQ